MASEYSGDVEDIAARVMYELLGRRWVWPAITTTETVQLVAGQSVIVLNGRPVTDIESVNLVGSTDQLPYTLENLYRVRLNKPVNAVLPPLVHAQGYSRWECDRPRSVEIRYTYGSQPPYEVAYAIEILAAELTKGMNDQSCRLPQRVQTVVRNGISMTLLDPQDFLNDGKTGIEEIDAALARFNPTRAKRPARVFGRMTPPPVRTNTI